MHNNEHTDETHFNSNSLARRLVLTRKWSFVNCNKRTGCERITWRFIDSTFVKGGG